MSVVLSSHSLSSSVSGMSGRSVVDEWVVAVGDGGQSVGLSGHL